MFALRVLAAGLLAGGALLSSARGAEAPEPIVVGVVLDLSGGGAAQGREARDALLLEAERANRAGGGVGGRQVVLVTVDTGDKPRAAAEAVKALASERGAVAVLGPAEGAAALAAAAEAGRQQIPLFALAAPEGLLEPAQRWVFPVAQPAWLGARSVLLHMSARGVRRAAVLGSSDAFGAEGRAQLSAQAPEVGISLLMNESFAPGERNFLPYLERARERGAEAFVHWGRGPSQLALVRARMALDLRLPIYMAPAVSGGLDLQAGGRAGEGVVFPAPRLSAAEILPADAPGLKEIRDFRKAFQGRYKRAPDGVAGHAADAFRLLVEAMRVAGTRRDRIPRYLVDVRHYNGLTGRFDFSETDHNGLGLDSFVMVRVKGGKWTLEGAPEGR